MHENSSEKRAEVIGEKSEVSSEPNENLR